MLVRFNHECTEDDEGGERQVINGHHFRSLFVILPLM